MSITRLLAARPNPLHRFATLWIFSLSCCLALLATPTIALAQFTGSADATDPATGTGVGTDITRINATDANNSTNAVNAGSAQLRQGIPARTQQGSQQGSQPEPRTSFTPPRYQPGEFERYVQESTGAKQQPTQDENGEARSPARPIRRFGANLVTDDAIASATQDPLPSVPGDYIIRPGDEVMLTLWGTVDADLQLTVDRAGRISVPHIGSISVAGLHNADLAEAISRRVSQTFKNFQLTATLGQVRAIRVFVGGYVQRPGTITVNGLASVLHAIMRAGGPSSAGSFRDIHLNRGGKEVAVFDLYDLLLKGNRETDQLVQPDDVIFIGPVGTQVAVLGSVNQPSIYELKPGETVADVLHMAGGFNAVADRTRVSIERLADRAAGRITQLDLPQHQGDVLATGDILRVFSVVSATLPKQFQRQHVRVEGEVLHPGDYILPPGSRISDLLQVAGGMTTTAYPYGTEFTRESVRKTQEINYDRALRDLETDMSRTQASQRVTSTEELTAQNATAAANARLVERLRQIRPTGRVVLQLPPDATALPDLALEDGDTLSIPTRGTSVGVFGSVFNTGSYVFEPGHTTTQYLAQAGGPTQGADKGSIFMIRANGSVISARQSLSFWHSNSEFNDAIVQPGDTLFVPEQVNKSTFVQDAKDWTQILYQFGLGLAGIKTLGVGL